MDQPDGVKKGISFGLSSQTSTSRRPGIKSNAIEPKATVSTKIDEEEDKQQAKGNRRVIQHIDKNRYGGKVIIETERVTTTTTTTTPSSPLKLGQVEADNFSLFTIENLKKYDPTKYGLQVRSRPIERPSSSSPSPSSPLLMQNVIPGLENIEDENEKFRKDLALRPEDITSEAYSRVPVEEFGAALLRGMGWEEGKGIGRNSAQGLVKPIEPKIRPKGLGLGADPDIIIPLKSRSPSGTPHQGSTNIPPPLPPGVATGISNTFKLNALVSIVTGDHAGMTGLITEMKASTIKVKLSSSGQVVTTERKDLTILRVAEEGKGSIDSNAFKRTDSPPTPGPTWLCPHIRVRVTSKELAGGSVYHAVGDILDTVMDESGVVRAVLRMNDGRLFSEIHQGQVQPLYPVTTDQMAMIIAGENRGERGRIISISGNQCHFQLIDSYEILNVPMENLAEHL